MRKLNVVLACAVIVIATRSLAGVYYVAQTTAEGGPGAGQQNTTVKGWVSGDNGKVVFESSKNPMLGQGSYIITKDGGKTMLLVNPKEKTYMKWDMESMMGFVGGAMKMMHFKYADPKVEKLAEEPDGLVAGIPTVHYRYRTSYTMSMSMLMIHKTTHVVKDEDIWAAPKLAEAALGIWLHKTPPKTGNEDLDRMVQAEMGRMQGFPLRIKTVSTDTDEKGKTTTTTVQMEVTELQMQPVPDSTFEVPADYKETTLTGADEGEGKGGESGNPFKGLFGKKNP
jgi:Domain of unknown function (DUF4412)